MIGSGSGVALGKGTLRSSGSNLGSSPYVSTCQFFGWINDAVVVTTLDGRFNGWNNGAVFVDTGVVTPSLGAIGYCTGSGFLQGLKSAISNGRAYCTGTGTLKGSAAFAPSSGAGYCTGTGSLRGKAALVGTGFGFCLGSGFFPYTVIFRGSGAGYCIGTGRLKKLKPPGLFPWYLRRVSPVVPFNRSRVDSPLWLKKTSRRPPRVRQVQF
jgi:hypothetical protein